jgi:hypothetical protein
MANGIVYSITPVPAGQQPTTGQVQQDETGDIFNFSDPNFPNTGLSVNSICSFTLSTSPKGTTIASSLAALTMNPPQVINTSVSENITAILGDVITITKGAVLTGNVTINGGKVIVDQSAQIQGSVNVTADGIIVARGGGQVNGNSIGINSGGSMKVINGGSVTGNSIGINQGGRMIIGNSNGPGTITGPISITGIRDISVTPDSSIIG